MLNEDRYRSIRRIFERMELRLSERDNLNGANKSTLGIDGMTVEDALPWLREYRVEFLESIR